MSEIAMNANKPPDQWRPVEVYQQPELGGGGAYLKARSDEQKEQDLSSGQG